MQLQSMGNGELGISNQGIGKEESGKGYWNQESVAWHCLFIWSSTLCIEVPILRCPNALFLDFLCEMLQDPGSSVGYPFIGLFLLTKIHPGFA